MHSKGEASALSEIPRPNHVPEQGWFIELDAYDLSMNRIWCDGHLMKCVKRVVITADIEETGGIPFAEITISTKVIARVHHSPTNQKLVPHSESAID
jgi:hypothetical protein